MGKSKSSSGCLGASVGCGAIVGVVCILICGGFTFLALNLHSSMKEKASADFAKAEAFYEKGQTSQAIQLYKDSYRLLDKLDKQHALERIVIFELDKQDNVDEVERWGDIAAGEGVSSGVASVQQFLDVRKQLLAKKREEERLVREAKARKNTPVMKGDIAILESDVGELFVATSEEAFDRLNDLSVARDEVGIRQLIAAGHVIIVPSGTKARMLNPGFATDELRIIDGPHAGVAIFVSTEFVKHP